MGFSSNPLSLSVPDPAFESWLRDTGYLEILDQRTSDLHRLTSTTTTTTDDDRRTSTTATTDSATATTTTTITNGFCLPLFSYIRTLLSLFTLNPFSKLTTDDFSGDTPSWTHSFIGFCGSYSFPSSPSQARLRVHENLKRYARNYASLFILLFACSLYQMPIALVGLLSSLALWDLFRFCGDRWGFDRYPVLRQTVVRIAQCGHNSCLLKLFIINRLSEYYLSHYYSNCHNSVLVQCPDGSLLCSWCELYSNDFACLISEADSCKATFSGKVNTIGFQWQKHIWSTLVKLVL